MSARERSVERLKKTSAGDPLSLQETLSSSSTQPEASFGFRLMRPVFTGGKVVGVEMLSLRPSHLEPADANGPSGTGINIHNAAI